MSTAVEGLPDAALVPLAADGDRDAFAVIYDRYADRIHSTCLRMLVNPDDAAEVTADVFLVAAQRLGQLRDPSRLRAWLFAIARREVYRRTSRRSRLVLTGEDADVDTPVVGTSGSVVEETAEVHEVVRALHEAASGLDESDRMVLELHLQGVEGADLAAALGVSAGTAYQASHRMKERLERSLGALFVARQGRDDCSGLARVLDGWDGNFSVLWRKRVARHVDGCDVCSERRRRVPATLLQGTAGAAEIVAAPISLRATVLDAAELGVATGRPWRGDGFPPAGRRRSRAVAFAVGVLVGIAVVVAGASLLGSADSPGPASGPGAPVVTQPAPTIPTVPSSTSPGTTPPGTTPPATSPPVSTVPPDVVPADPGTPGGSSTPNRPSGGGSGGATGGGGGDEGSARDPGVREPVTTTTTPSGSGSTGTRPTTPPADRTRPVPGGRSLVEETVRP